MALKFSQGVVNSLAMGMGWGDIMQNSVCVIYSGSQPATPEVAATAGTELVRFTLGGATLTPETRAWSRFVIAGSSGTVNLGLNLGASVVMSLTGSNVAYTSSLLATKNAVVAAINNNWTYPDFYAVPAGTTIGGITYGTAVDGEFIVFAPKNSGVTFNTATVTFANTTMTGAINGGAATTTATGAFASATNGATGGSGASGLGVAATNGLTMSYPPIAGSISKAGTWSGTASVTGSAGWFRVLCTPNWDANGTANISTANDDARLILRIDGSVGTSGADMIVSSTSITSAIVQTASAFSLTVPAA